MMEKYTIKKRLALMLMILLFSISLIPGLSFAQGKGGIKFGLTMASLVGDDSGNLNYKPGFTAGAFLLIGANGTFKFRPEILYTMKGARDELEVLGEKIDVSFNINYLEIPLLVQISPLSQTGIKPCYFFGPAIGMNLSAEVKAEVDGESATEDIKEVTRPIDVGYIVGLGATIDLRFNLGITSIDDSEDEADIKNSAFSLMFGFHF